MSNPKFIQIPTALNGTISVALDNIASVKRYFAGATITLKEVKDGNNVEINTSASYNQVMSVIDQLSFAKD